MVAEAQGGTRKPGIRKLAAAQHHWQAWVSNTERLLRIAKILDEQVLLLRRQTSQEGGSFTLPEDRYAVQLETWEKEFSLRQVGAPQEVLESVDPMVLQSIVLSVGRRGTDRRSHSVALNAPLGMERAEIARNDPLFVSIQLTRSFGALLEVRGDNPDWVRGAFSALESEIGRGVPAWSRLRSGWMWWPYTILGCAATFIALQPSLATHILWLGLAALVGGVAIGTGFVLLTSWLLPGFEIVAGGKAGKGSRVLSLVGAAILQFLIGIAVYFATKS
jgi:hypothetical protein